jgi:hypothetical protein
MNVGARLSVGKGSRRNGGGAMLRWLRQGMGGSASAVSGVIAALEEFYNPAAARARQELNEQHERVIPVPSPGDKLLEEGKIVLRRKTGEAEEKPAPRPFSRRVTATPAGS